MNQSVIWLDGNLVPWNQANIHIMTHTLHYGSGALKAFDVMQLKMVLQFLNYLIMLIGY